ncbi:MAG TPA: NEW3 domain-containing protein, partial [Longimicrobium sp.]|nr:NEW3 domain-containing protein [Longimicrobium sp.]
MGPRRLPILQPSPALTFLAPWRPAALALLAVLLASTAAAQTGRVLVQRRDNVELRVRPGASGTAVFRVTNPGAAPLVFRPAASLPAGWAVVATEGAAQLAPGARAIRFVGFAVPRDARAGAYTVRLAAAGQPGDSVRVIVAALRELSLRTRDAPRFVVGG